jgi:glycine cleavage system H protein
MSAGLVRYKLCDRDFDCERCPLDAALRGDSEWRQALPTDQLRSSLAFPDDRRYTAGHLWVEDRGAVARVGVDAMAAALLGTPTRLCWAGEGRVEAGGCAVTLELSYGAVPLASPPAGRALRPNAALGPEPALMVNDPYGAGWLFEVESPRAGGARLVGGALAREQAGLDLRHFRRRAALGLLTDADPVGPTMADGGEALTDLRRMLGPRGYLALVREIVH